MSIRILSFLFFMTTLPGSCVHDHTRHQNICGAIPAITGYAGVLDGDTLVINEPVDGIMLMVNKHKIRLAEVDAPETKQQCQYKDTGEFYSCGIKAKEALQELVAGEKVTCCKQKLDIYKRMLATCFVGDINLNQQMISSGNAILYRNSKAYKEEQLTAKQLELGMWSSYFQEPWVWRKEKKRKAK